MMLFFRKLRQNLLTENKVGKYILYAIGEIALQVNNWNEERKKNNLKASYKTSLINDLVLDTLLLEKLKSTH